MKVARGVYWVVVVSSAVAAFVLDRGAGVLPRVSATLAAPGVVAAYGFDQSTGSVLYDASGNGLNGTLYNGPVWTSGRNGNALAFDGANDYVDLGNRVALQMRGSMTLSAWVFETAEPYDDGQIVAKANASWQLKSTPDTGVRTFAIAVNSPNGLVQRYSRTVRTLNTWYHVTGVYDAAAQTLDIYVNGVLDDGVLSGQVPSAQWDVNSSVNIGRRAAGFYLHGKVDDLRIYARALTAAEVQADMNTPVSPSSTDTTAPSVSITAPASGTTVSGTTVVSASASDDVGVAGVQFMLDGAPLGAEDTTAPYSVSWNTSTAPAGFHTLSARARDAAGNTATSAAVTVTVAATQGGATGSVVINGGAASTSSASVTLTLSATSPSGPVTQMRFSNDGATFSAPEPYSTTKAWTLGGRDGTKTVFAQFADSGGVWSPSATDTILLDTTAPVASALGTAQTTTTSVHVTWTTNEPATSQVEYGTTTSYGSSTPVDATLVTGHDVTLSALSPATTYDFRARSRDAAGNEGVSSNGTFTTSAVSGGGGSPGTPALVQHTASSSNDGGSIYGNAFRFTPPNPVLAGNALILGITYTHATNRSVTITDTAGNSWPTAPAARAVDTNSNDTAIYVLANARPGPTTITVTFDAPVRPFQYTLSEFRNVATTSPVGGASQSSASVAPNVSAGTFTPSNNDANGGNLIWSYCMARTGGGSPASSITAGGGMTLLDANRTWTIPSASAYTVQATAASITPAMTFSGTSDPYNCVAVALAAASAGTAPGPGIRIVKILHLGKGAPYGSGATFQAPTTGNLVVVSTWERDITFFTSASDSRGNAYTLHENSTGNPSYWVAANATPDSNLAITLSSGNYDGDVTAQVFDISGASSSPVDGLAGVYNGCTGGVPGNDLPSFTPASAPGLTIASVSLGTGPSPGLASGSPPGATFDYVTYGGETDFDMMDNADGRAHFYNSDGSTEHWNWLIQNNTTCTGAAIHFK